MLINTGVILLPSFSAESTTTLKSVVFEVIEAAVKRPKAYAKAYHFENTIKTVPIFKYIFIVVFTTKVESRQTICSSLFPKTGLSELFSLLRSITSSSCSLK